MRHIFPEALTVNRVLIINLRYANAFNIQRWANEQIPGYYECLY